MQPLDWGYKAGCGFVMATLNPGGCIAYANAHPRQQELCRLTPQMRSGREDVTCSYDSRVVVGCAAGKTSAFGGGCEVGGACCRLCDRLSLRLLLVIGMSELDAEVHVHGDLLHPGCLARVHRA
jgi:hypothetical protein